MYLNQNPFYLLEISPKDKRATIISKAEEKAFFLDDGSGEAAQATLLNPAKRLLAELDWFLDVNKKEIKKISKCIAENKEISTEGLSPISKINALLFNFSIMQDVEAYDIGFMLTDIDEQFGLVTIDSVLEIVNTCRKEAGMKIVSEAEVDEAIDAKRYTIRQIFTEKLHALSDEEYMAFVSILAKQYVANEDYDDGIVISDALDQYEIRMQTEIQKHAEAVEKHIERIKGLSDETAIKENIRGLIKRIKEWDAFVQPLQLRSQASGMPHDNSMSLGREIRDLALYLHNEKELTEIALDLVTAMQDIFAEVGDLAERLEEDAEQLENIIKTNKVAKELMSEMEALKSAADRMGSYTTMSDVDSFIARVKRLDSTVEDSDVEYELLEKIRISICVVAREAAIKLHNNYQKTNLALKIAKALLAQFGDIDELKTRLQEDAQSLAQQSFMLERVQAAKKAQEDSARTKKIVAWVFIGIILFIILIASLSECDGSSSSSSSSSNNGGYSSSGSYYPSGGSSSSSGGSSGNSSNKNNNNNNDKIVLTSSNFEDYFTITTSAEYKGNTVTISYSIKPKSTAYAADSSSASSITVKLRGGVYPYSFSTSPTYSSTESITLYKSSGYKKSGTITVYVSSGADEIYWGTDVTSASGTIYK